MACVGMHSVYPREAAGLALLGSSLMKPRRVPLRTEIPAKLRLLGGAVVLLPFTYHSDSRLTVQGWQLPASTCHFV